MENCGEFVKSLLPWKSNNIFLVCVRSLRYPACNAHAPYWHLWPVRLYGIFLHYLLNLLGITKLDKEKKNQCIREKTGAENIVKEIKLYQEKWLQHIQRMDTNRIPKQALQYKPKGRKHIGRPRKRWRDQFHFEDTRNRNQT